EQAAALKAALSPGIKAVGVFVDAPVETVARFLRSGSIDAAQLHGSEDDEYIARLQRAAGRPIIRAFRVRAAADAEAARHCRADLVLLDSGAGTGAAFDWSLAAGVKRDYLLAGGLTCDNVAAAVHALHPWGVDVSSGIETDGLKDREKMAAFVAAVRKEDEQ
ncbi:MAG: phosphoribosylanthranilate isomerase, partial [Pyramidobacter sp.]|nr:phosphoribosylanthranilate isomerase [Pyramidobacter sp.]